MYLPQSVPLSRPHVALWFGRSGKRYDFAVSRARPLWLGQPVVYVLVRYEGDNAIPLFIGRATAADPQLGGPASDAISAWEQAMALGMTHLHLRFEACTEDDRVAEVEDLIATLCPPLNAVDIAAEARPDAEEAELAVVHAPAPLITPPRPPVEAARLPWDRGWLGRRAAALVAHLRQRRMRARAAPAAAPVGLVPVRADAIVAADANAGPAAHEAEPAAAETNLNVVIEPPAVLAEPSEPAAEPVVERAVTAAVEATPAAGREEVRQQFGFGSDDVVVLFAGEIGWPAGTDLIIEAMATVHADPLAVRLLLVGEGPLRAELEARAWHGGFAQTCRFVGDVSAEAFSEVFAACDAVVIPARVGQNPLLAEHSLGAGRPVLTTHQAQLGCVRHGENGLVTYDNPGSMVWGLREIGSLVARRRAPAALAA